MAAKQQHIERIRRWPPNQLENTFGLLLEREERPRERTGHIRLGNANSVRGICERSTRVAHTRQDCYLSTGTRESCRRRWYVQGDATGNASILWLATKVLADCCVYGLFVRGLRVIAAAVDAPIKGLGVRSHGVVDVFVAKTGLIE